MEDQLSSLGLVLTCVVLWNTVYMDRALAELRVQDYPVLDADVARLSPFIRTHIGIDGHYGFSLPDLGGTHRPLRDPDAPVRRMSLRMAILGVGPGSEPPESVLCWGPMVPDFAALR